MEANNTLSKAFKNKKKEIGIRVPDNNIPRELVKTLGHPIAATSLHSDDEILEYPTDAELIYDDYKHIADTVIDGGAVGNIASTVVDLTSGEPELIRAGKGSFDEL
jgi:tRNA A37 threonylcarbamoyladenosine synthetase subunit TsaC/SUA5/YrdC